LNSLELKIPPVVVVIVTALLMWLVSLFLPKGAVVVPGRFIIAATFAFVGVVVSVLGVIAFRRASTTVNPTKPESTSSLVSSGVYGVTRNPMYLGFVLMLFGWALLLANMLAFLALPGFLYYMNRFQIQPEERALASRFGKSFAIYTAHVGRWF
jgi:protein-S-isoprenylcysteine O-methyltransferase Ste14